jgi:hypothetical protein
MPRDPAEHPVESHGPAEAADIGKARQVPPQPTIPYTLGRTPKQQTRILMIGIALWVCVALLVLKSYIFGR